MSRSAKYVASWFSRPARGYFENGFDSKGVITRVTTGVLIHKEIFIVSKDGEEVGTVFVVGS